MELTPDTIVFWQWGPVHLNATLLYSWFVMAILVIGSWLMTRKLSVEGEISNWQGMLESVIGYIQDQIEDITGEKARPYLPFVGTIFLFISISNLLSPLPIYEPPTSSFSTTIALATCVFFAVPIYGVMRQGVWKYLKHYIQPSVIMLPFHIISEISRTFALAVRLFGNLMSGSLVVGIMLSIIPFFLPVVLQALELLIGQIQAYIFAVLSTVYIASAASESRGGG